MKKVVCLSMIVRNESRVIERMLRSVCPIISHYCICDTGSSDDTCKRIESFFRCHYPSITGTITHEPFRDFAYNRNVALQDCLVRYAHCDLILLMDADMVLRIFDCDYELPEADYYYIMQGSSHMQYKNVRIIKTRSSYHYVGATHEYLHVLDGDKGHLIDACKLSIDDIGDGGCKDEKFTRDIALLHQSIESDPTNARALFYLANSYMDIGRFDEAVVYYQKRIGCGGWNDERYMASHRIGLSYLHLGKESEAIAAFISACRYSKCRLESLYELIKLHRISGHHSIAMGFYAWAKSIQSNIGPDAERDFLFTQCDVYDFLIDYEYTIFAFYNGESNVLDSVVRVLNRCNDYAKCANVIENLAFYQHTADCMRLYDVLVVETDISCPISCCVVRMSDASVLFAAYKDPHESGFIIHRIDSPSPTSTIVTTHRLTIVENMLPQIRITSSPGSLLWTCFSCIDGDVTTHHGVVDVTAVPLIEITGSNHTTSGKTTELSVVEHVMASTSPVAWACHTSTPGRQPQCIILDMSPTVFAHEDWINTTHLRFRRVERPPFFSHVASPFFACMFNGQLWCIGHLKGKGAYMVAFVCDDMRVLRFSGPLTLHATGSCIGLFVDTQQVSIVWRSATNVLQIGEYSHETFDGLLCYTKES